MLGGLDAFTYAGRSAGAQREKLTIGELILLGLLPAREQWSRPAGSVIQGP